MLTRKGSKGVVVPAANDCRRCGYSWTSRVTNPKECPSCKSRAWAFHVLPAGRVKPKEGADHARLSAGRRKGV